MNHRIRCFLPWSLLAAACLMTLSPAMQGAIQTISVTRGWNLIAIQVEPDDSSPSAVFGNLNGIKSVWTHDNESKRWFTWIPATESASEANSIPGVGIQRVAMGQSFWVEVTVNNPDFKINGSIPQEAPPTTFYPGWNLIGFPVAGEGTSILPERSVPVFSVINKAGATLNAQWTCEDSPAVRSSTPDSARLPDGSIVVAANSFRDNGGLEWQGASSQHPKVSFAGRNSIAPIRISHPTNRRIAMPNLG